MENLWKKRRPPTPLEWLNICSEIASSSKQFIPLESEKNGIKDQHIWSPEELRDVFANSVTLLKNRSMALPEGAVLVWDKDDDASMDFVASCANLRALAFQIPMKSRFDIKCK